MPSSTTKCQVLQLLERYSLKQRIPLSILTHLQSEQEGDEHSRYPVTDGCYTHVQNVIIGSNRTATQAASATAQGLGYSCLTWSHRIRGEARNVGAVYAKLIRSLCCDEGEAVQQVRERELVECLQSCDPDLKEDLGTLLHHRAKLGSRPFCLISAGEPTVTVHEGSTGIGGRSQELALAFALSLSSEALPKSYVLASVGTDGQDGPGCDAAGAMVDTDTAKAVEEDSLRPESYLENNDSYTFFSRLRSGKYLIRTGLTGTNVMDIHILLVK